ncbi:MAG: MFS transporter [SAR202 cluster bacterium]|nr:MFS transporter [SAR202 cluster bacterium]
MALWMPRPASVAMRPGAERPPLGRAVHGFGARRDLATVPTPLTTRLARWHREPPHVSSCERCPAGVPVPADAAHRRKPRIFHGWWIVLALFMSNFAVEATAIFSFAVFLRPMSEDLNISRQAISWVMAARRLASGAASIAIGRFVDRHGGRWMIAGALVIASLATAALGLVQNTGHFLVLFIVIGLSAVTMPGNLLTSVPVQKWFVRKRGRATGFVTSGFGIGAMVFVLLHQQLIDTIGWRQTWVISGALTAALSLPLVLLFVRRAPEDMGLRPDGDDPATAPVAGARPRPAYAAEQSWTSREALRTFSMWKILAAYVLVSFAMGGLQLHRAAFWEDRGYGRDLVATSYSIDSLIFFLAILGAGFLVERFPVRYVAGFAMTFTIVGVALMIAVNATWVLFASAVLLGVGQGTSSVMQVHIWPAYYGRAHIGTIRGYIVPAILVAQALGAPFAGFFYDATGSYDWAFWISGAAVAISGVLLVSAKPPHRSAPSPTAMAAA